MHEEDALRGGKEEEGGCMRRMHGEEGSRKQEIGGWKAHEEGGRERVKRRTVE